MYFTGTIVDTESEHIGKDTHYRSFARHALATHDLNAAINDSPFSF
jgi:hypothetical protein